MSDDKRIDADLASLTGAYALNALSPEERAAFEAELETSETLRHEVTELADTAVVLGLAVTPIAPPPALKANILGLIASMPQLPPLETRDASAADATASVTDIGTRRPVETAAPAAAYTEAATPSARKAQSRWFTRPAVVLAGVAAAVGLIAGGGVLVNTIGTASTQSVQADALAAITSASDSQQAVAEVSGGGTAKLVWSNSLGSSAVMVDGLAVLASDKVYELWYIDGESVARPAGTFTVGDDGSTWRVLDGDMKAGDLVGITVEPAGGSEQPTTAPIVGIQSA